MCTDPQEHLAFLTSLLSRIETAKAPEAHVLLLASIAHAKLLYGDLEGTKTDMDAAQKILDTLEDVDSGVNAAYYGVSADYYKAKAEYAPYYRNSLLYLACVDIEEDMSAEERLARAHDLGISALLGDTIYNFGELVRRHESSTNWSDRLVTVDAPYFGLARQHTA
jgi:26S proteasome regulatory subunit N9